MNEFEKMLINRLDIQNELLVKAVTALGSISALTRLATVEAKLVDQETLGWLDEDIGKFSDSLEEGVLARYIENQLITDCPTPDELPFDPILLKKIDQCDFNTRMLNCMGNEGLIYVGDLTSFPMDKLLKIPNLGPKSIREFKRFLERYNLWLGMKLSYWPPANVEELSKKYHG